MVNFCLLVMAAVRASQTKIIECWSNGPTVAVRQVDFKVELALYRPIRDPFLVCRTRELEEVRHEPGCLIEFGEGIVNRLAHPGKVFLAPPLNRLVGGRVA